MFRVRHPLLNRVGMTTDRLGSPVRAETAQAAAESLVNLSFEEMAASMLVIHQNHLAVLAAAQSSHPSRAANLVMAVQQTERVPLEVPWLGRMLVEPYEPRVTGW